MDRKQREESGRSGVLWGWGGVRGGDTYPWRGGHLPRAQRITPRGEGIPIRGARISIRGEGIPIRGAGIPIRSAGIPAWGAGIPHQDVEISRYIKVTCLSDCGKPGVTYVQAGVCQARGLVLIHHGQLTWMNLNALGSDTKTNRKWT
ncbi:hypothetical protein G5B36_02695 [Enterocloster aldensis]|uniref:Uncharacterized protein n=1 Tax=Enterocloster aldenensis TaxID=358742 RepID=A0ABX2HFD2_9FIRM|nr:hypothetical protein [Clostridium sp.]NSJ47608.1 hypothetical protein [Enterocloster aldenensis]